MPRDPTQQPEPGDTATKKRGGKLASVTRVDHHLNSTDISYIRVKYDSGYERTIVFYEWLVEFRDHQAGSNP